MSIACPCLYISTVPARFNGNLDAELTLEGNIIVKFSTEGTRPIFIDLFLNDTAQNIISPNDSQVMMNITEYPEGIHFITLMAKNADFNGTFHTMNISSFLIVQKSKVYIIIS